jgi:hypothetical protein
MIQNITLELEEPEEIQSTNFAFSRYLYVIDDVKSSLLLSILDHEPKEALYWAYELYFSGFKDDAFTTLLNTAQSMYSPKVQRFVQQQKDKWDDNPDQYWLLGTVVWYLADRPADISKFVTSFCQDPELIQQIKNKPIARKRDTRITILLEKKDVHAYINVETARPDHLLKHVLKYPPRTYVSQIFEHDHANYSAHALYEMWSKQWLYYATKSPLWQRRIAHHDGIIDDAKKTVTFPDDNSDLEDQFNEKYYYDTDEQPKQIVELCLGKRAEQWSWRQFYEHYTN